MTKFKERIMKTRNIAILSIATVCIFALSAFSLKLSKQTKVLQIKKAEINLLRSPNKKGITVYNPHQEVAEVHWFYIRVRPNIKKKAYTLVGTASRVESGKEEEFERALWWGMTRGQMAIGPFWDVREAKDARLLYRKSRKRVVTTRSRRNTKEVHWFLVTFKQRKRSNAYKLQRMPARLASGSVDEFLDALYESMTFERLTVGPFWDYNEAENAKTLYRKNE